MDGIDGVEGQINELTTCDGNMSDSSLGVKEGGGSTARQSHGDVDEGPRGDGGSADILIWSDGEADDSGKRDECSAADTV